MAKISINLLPYEFIAEEIKSSKFYKVQAIGIAVIVGISLLASMIIAFRILQNYKIISVQARLTQAQQRVTDLKSTQGSLVLLKDRLRTIDLYLGVPSKQTSMYGLVDQLVPPSILVNSVTVDRGGNVVLVATSSNSAEVDNLIDGLTTKKEGADIVKEVEVERLSRGIDGVYRISLKITPR